jgi:branched-chain amino acid transport system substrate-binding protein
MTRAVTRAGARRALAVVLLACAFLSACSLRKQYGVSTHTDVPSGNCDSSRIVELGASLDLSGPQAALGHEYLTGIEMAVSHINHNGGILQDHSCLELLYKDDRGDLRVGNQAVLDLVNNEVVNLLVGPFQSRQVEFAGANLGLAGVPSTTFSSLDQVRNPGTYPTTFPTAPSQASVASVMGAYATSHGWSRVAVAVVGDPAGREGLAALQSEATRDRYSVVGTVLLRPGQRPAPSVLAPLESVGPQALLVVGDTTDVAQALVARSELSWSVPTLVPPVGASEAVVGAVGARRLSGVSAVVAQAVVTAPGVASSDPSMLSFISRLEKKLGSSSLQGSVIPYAEAYDGVSMLAYAARSTNSDTAGNLRTFLENANYQGLLASYGYTSGRHGGVSPQQLTVAPLASISGGLLHG